VGDVVKFRSSISTLAMVVIFISSAFAAKHPVPLDKDVKDAQCIECHEAKTKGAHVHTAVSMGCLSCHEVRVNKDVTRIKLIKTTTQALCITCHADKNAADAKGL